MANVVIVGAGLAGLSAGLVLNRLGHAVTIIEKKCFPFHKVCGEYISNEVLPFLDSFGIDIRQTNAASLTRFKVTSTNGKQVELPLDLGGFGLSRYRFDELLYKQAISEGISFRTETKVTDIRFVEEGFLVQLADSSEISADLVIGAYGKRSNLDQKLQRRFFYNRSPYMGVKYHIRADFPVDLIQLDLFRGGYSGICKIEDDKYSLCYLSVTENLKQFSTVAEMEQNVLFQNPFFRQHYQNAEFLAEPAEVINQVTFEQKPLVENHILFCGDAAGMISPLCGNGMAMAIHGGKILGETIDTHLKLDPALHMRHILENSYRRYWNSYFQARLHAGQWLQKLFLQPFLADTGLTAFKAFPALAVRLMKKSHGRPF
jgi:menaquinone-9 beta-reductase